MKIFGYPFIGTGAYSAHQARAALAAPARRHIGKIGAELLPARRDQIRTDEGQQMLAPSLSFLPKQVALVDAVDRPVVRHLAAGNLRQGGEEIHDREHGRW